ncbi:MAG: PDDEXK nuclease domain-containing protein [Holosporaceae bacterium]|jgi:predicted nuclease of restriction endonuclease-like (RecB) superfamily|nr:PDDEXK nuclease domain-containing protein [Holosporaceae bacterium]
MAKIPVREKKFFAEIAAILRQGRAVVYKAVNSAMVETYWHIGKRIVEQEQNGKNRADYGDYLITNLSRYLGDAFGKGFTEANIRNFRQFYLTFPVLDEFATHCVANLTWTHIRQIMRISSENERNYYLSESSQQNWSTRTLERNIRTGYYRRILSSQKAGIKQLAKKSSSPIVAENFIKDPYVLEFLNVPEDLASQESLLESEIINHLQKFLLELGKGFSFVARQLRISTETSHFYLDLVFYNYLLKCFVVIYLKTRKLTHQDIGQMDMYVRMFDALKKGHDDNPTLGIIFCTAKDETIVKYSVLEENKQIFASKYKTILPTETELADLVSQENQKLLEDKTAIHAKMRHRTRII